ncbi:MAG: amidohydrolase family protein [Phycisphaeraceae bacterium]|nr:amidohydrolase family protein [Phycisphaeraceae bacterium]
MAKAVSDLAQHIQQTPLVDSHEHLKSEQEYVAHGPDVLRALFNHYMATDLRTAGATQEDIDRAADATNSDIEARFAGIRPAWEKAQYTGYGQAVKLTAELVYGMREITVEAIVAAEARNRELRQPGQRLRLLREVAHIDHVQIDDFRIECEPDSSGPEFFLYDLSWAGFASGDVLAADLERLTGRQVKDLSSFADAQKQVFERYAPLAIAVKTQHAYRRTLQWQKRSDDDAQRCLSRKLAGQTLEEGELRCLGDWSLARGVEMAIDHHLPVKIHTGYYAGWNSMMMDRIRPAHLCALLLAYPQARFVLMHAGYPYGPELLAIAKQFTNVTVDLCWAWSINPYSVTDFARQMIHSLPSNKVFAFGGDTFWPMAAVAYAAQARLWLTRALEAEVADQMLSENQAMGVASAWMIDNQRSFFDLESRRRAIRQAI